MKAKEEKTQLQVETKTLITPSGHTVTIRMQTGEDDDILSNAQGVLDGTSSNNFVAGIVIKADINDDGNFSMEDALELKLSDKYFIMIASRIFSIGQHLKFAYAWEDGIEGDYEEDLGLYIWDYHNPDNPFPEKGSEDFYKYRIPQHPFGKDTQRVFKISTGKELRYKFMNGRGERWLMELPEDKQSVNAELLARGIELKMGEQYIIIENFKTFSPKEMMEIRNDISENDSSIMLVTEITNPKTKEIVQYPIMGNSDFFYPREV